MLNTMKKTILMGAGLAVLTTEKIKELVDELVKRGELSEKEAKETLEELREKSRQAKQEWEAKIENTIKKIMAKANIPTRKEIEELKERLTKLEEKIKVAD
ncbi:MAG: hypothetical protein N2317_01775 [Syntrophales bacterium]|nr:hypothetical protein [Syntrophales bacterium]